MQHYNAMAVMEWNSTIKALFRLRRLAVESHCMRGQ